jgi:acyl-CoA thioester hydrolase
MGEIALVTTYYSNIATKTDIQTNVPKIYLKRITVGEGAIDIHRHANNQEYLRWLQDIAIDHSAGQGWTMERYMQSGATWYVKSHFIEYLRPALLGDELLIGTWISQMNERTCQRNTLFVRQSDQRMLARAETQWSFVSLVNGRPLRIPEEIRSAFDIVETEDEALSVFITA